VAFRWNGHVGRRNETVSRKLLHELNYIPA
jgi:hypothetical protein